MRALIVEDGYSRGALAAARALGSAGWAVGIGSRRRGLASSSRFTTYNHSIPLPYEDPDRFIEKINRAAVAVGYDVVFGAGDAEILALSKARNELKVKVPYPDHEVVERALDKLELARAAERAGLSTPRTLEPKDIGAGLEPPILVKARLHSPPGTVGGQGRIEASVATTLADARRRIARIEELGAAPLVQDLVRGHLMAVVVLRDIDGKIVSCVQQEAELIWPEAAGISVRARTVPVDEDLRDGVSALLEDLSWYGLAELQFVADDDGTAWLIDLNGRFYGSLALAVGAGPDLPTKWATLATGAPHVGIAEATSGVRYQWLEGDLRRAFEERRGGLARDVVDCLRYARGAKHSIWSSDDRWPAIRYIFELGWRGIRKALA
ncbi:MAG: hypothetical protein QOC87_427 [Actinomycetota bacterium]|jgi:predicted ATP-grasp superfamily ATP-dependent carboligase|nr:hypothetical protein [Actinomycetota bacterium]